MKKCIVCMTEYEYCPSCAEFANEPKWKNLFHDKNCMNIFHAVSDYLIGEITKDDARDLLSKCDISDPTKYNEKVQKTLKELFPPEQKKVEKIKVDSVKRHKVVQENE